MSRNTQSSRSAGMAWGGVFLLLFFSQQLYAGWYSLGGGQQFQMHGFATQGYVKTNSNNLFGNSRGDKGSFDFREIGVVGSYRASKSFYFSSQLLSRKIGNASDGKIDLDFAIVDYRLVDNMSYNFGVRAGRIKNPYGLFNDTRDIAFTRQNILLPQSIYFERSRDLSMSSDGIELYSQVNRKFGYINFQFVASYPRVDSSNFEDILLRDEKPGSFVKKLMYISKISLHGFNDKLTLAYSNVQFNLGYEPEVGEANFTSNADFAFRMNIISAQLKYQYWIITGEYARRQTKFSGMPTEYVPTSLANITGESYYIQLTHILNYRFRVYTRYDILYQNIDDRYGSAYAGVPYSRYAKDYLIGLQWNISNSWMIRAELHEVEGVAWLSRDDNPNTSDPSKFWRIGMLSISYRY